MRNRLFRRELAFGPALCVLGLALSLACWSSMAQSAQSSAASPEHQGEREGRATNTSGHYPMLNTGVSPKDDPAVRADASQFVSRRDPFKLPPPPTDNMGDMALSSHRPPGPRGLIVSDLKLGGIVSENSGHDMIAVVTNNTGRAYFLRANEQLFDGSVTKITLEAVYFVETVRDRKGRESVQPVVKWLNPKPGDAQ